jgi:SAM-dependent methyltransferase
MHGAENRGNTEDAWILPFSRKGAGSLFRPSSSPQSDHENPGEKDSQPLDQERTWGVKQSQPTTQPDRLFQVESFVPPPPDNAEPYTLQWYLAIEHHRHHRQAKWIPELLEFGKHPGETLLGIGPGLGTDLVQYARHGARVIACSALAEELSLIRRNFELRGLHARFARADSENLPLAGSSVDVALVHGLLHELARPANLIAEVFRVLKPGGKVVAVVPAKYSVAFWFRTLGTRTVPVGLSRRRLKKLFSPFDNYRIYKRHIRRRDLPWVTRCLPRRWLERCLGNYLILKAFKPVSLVQQRAAA